MCIGNRRVIKNQLCLNRQAQALTGLPTEEACLIQPKATLLYLPHMFCTRWRLANRKQLLISKNVTKMKNVIIETDLNNISEVQLVYRTKIKPNDRPKVGNLEDAVAIFRKYWDRDKIEHIEEVKILLLNRTNKVLGIATVSIGGVSGTVMDERIILQYAIKANASGVIMAHNHHSGNIEPSDADNKITSKIKGCNR